MSNGMTRDIDLHDSLKYPKYKDPVTMSRELNNISTDREMSLKINKIEGRTIVNLLGIDGDCEDVSKWNSQYQMTASLDSTNKVFGTNSIKGTIASGYTYGNIAQDITSKIDKTKYYCLSGYLKNKDLPNGFSLSIYPVGMSNINTPTIRDTIKFNRTWVKVKPSDFSGSTQIWLECMYVEGATAGQYAYVDGIMLEEISAEDYNNPNFEPSPYVSGDMSVGDVVTRIKSRSKNLLNLVQGTYDIIHENIGRFVPYIDRITHKDGRIAVDPNTTYTVSLNKPLIYNMHELGKDGNILTPSNTWSSSATVGFSFTTSVNTKYICIAFKISDGTTIYPENYQIMLNEGSESLPYEKYEYTFAPIQYPYRSIPNTDIGDTHEEDKGRIQRVERKILDGSLGWSFVTSVTGYKAVSIPTPVNYLIRSGVCYKYNNKIINHSPNNDVGQGVDLYSDNPTNWFVTIPNSDSGWGDSYTPTADEIKAYFNGWRMYLNQAPYGLYNGTGAKGWQDINGRTSDQTGILPTTMSTGFTPYRLYYQLATPVITELNIPNLVAYPSGNLIVESDSQSWVRPQITYQIAENEKANIDEVMKQVSNNTRLNNNKPYCRIYQNINVVIPNATAFKVPFNTIDADNFGMFDKTNNRIMIKENGIYDIKSCVGFDTNTVGFREILIKVNGALYIADSTILPVANNPTSVVVATTKKLNVGEYIEIMAVQYSGSSISLRGDIPQFLSVIKVGD